MSRKVLGRGLEALIPTRSVPGNEAGGAGATATIEPHEPHELRTAEIRPNPYQPRRRFEPEKLAELAASVRANGILQPLVVRRKDGHFELVAGERRLRAARVAELEKVPVVVRSVSDDEQLRLAILENVQREDLNPIEEARGYKRLFDEFDMSQQQLAEQVGKSRTAIAHALRLLQLPQAIQARIEDGELTPGHARALLALDGEERQLEVADMIRDRTLTVRKVEDLARSARPSRKRGRPVAAATGPSSASLTELQKRLEHRLGTRVRLRARRADGSAGRVEIDYYSVSDLERIFGVLGVAFLL